MKFIAIAAYDNYIPAHIALGRLQGELINCYLKNEYSITLDPFLSNALGGIQLMVADYQVDRAVALLNSPTDL